MTRPVLTEILTGRVQLFYPDIMMGRNATFGFPRENSHRHIPESQMLNCYLRENYILADGRGYSELYDQIDILLDRCVQFNLTMKIAKKKYFGQLCRKDSYELTRKNSLAQIPFPSTLRTMQSLFRFAFFFKPFMMNYSHLAAPLNDTIRKDFNWNPASCLVIQ